MKNIRIEQQPITNHLSEVGKTPKIDTNLTREGSNDKKDQMQGSFLNHCRKDRVPIFLDLISGSQASGIIIGFDESTIVLEQNNSQCLFFKRNVTCVRPKREVNYIFNEAYRYRGNSYADYTNNHIYS